MNKNESISYTEMQKFFAREIKEVGGRPITSKNLELSLLPIHARKTFLRQKCRGIPKLMISIWSSDAHHSGWLPVMYSWDLCFHYFPSRYYLLLHSHFMRWALIVTCYFCIYLHLCLAVLYYLALQKLLFHATLSSYKI